MIYSTRSLTLRSQFAPVLPGAMLVFSPPFEKSILPAVLQLPSIARYRDQGFVSETVAGPGVPAPSLQAGFHGMSGKQMRNSCLRLSQFDVYRRSQGVSGAHAGTFKTALAWRGFFSIQLISRIHIVFLKLRGA